MNIQRVPRVRFGLQLKPRWGAPRLLALWFEQHLSKRFGPVRIFRPPFASGSLLTLNLNEFKMAVGIRRESRKIDGYDEWYIFINPYYYPVPKKALPIDEEKRYAKALMLVSDEIQALLVKLPGILGLRWFFEGWDIKKSGVLTPRELPWQNEND